MIDLVKSELPVAWRRFRPATEGTIGQVHRVEVVFVERIGSDTIGVCRGLDDPSWFYEIATPRPLAVASFGTVRNQGFYHRIAPRWLFTPDPESQP